MKPQPFQKQHLSWLGTCIALALLMSLACNLPSLLSATAEPSISSEILTQAAATIEHELLLTASEEQLAIATDTPTSTPTKTSTFPPPTPSPTVTSSLSPTPTLIPPSATITPTTTFTPFPTLPFFTSAEAKIKIRNLNIYPCYGIPWGIFKITNLNSYALESSSILFEDLNAGHIISGPYQSNAPFMYSDRTCSMGIDRLPSGGTRYLGYSMGTSQIREHLIRTTIILCSGENLSGICHTLIVEFTMP